MTDETRAREFLLTVNTSDNLHFRLFFNKFVRPNMFKDKEQLHVIEYSAYESEKARADGLEAEIEHLKQNLSEACAARDHWRKIHLENNKLKKAYEEIYATYTNYLNNPESKVQAENEKLKAENADERARADELAQMYANSLKHITKQNSKLSKCVEALKIIGKDYGQTSINANEVEIEQSNAARRLLKDIGEIE